jgi:hypothetical protein
MLRMREVCAAVVAFAAGCGARAGGPGDDTSGDDAPAADAPASGSIDAPPAPDAAPCVEGDARVVGPDGTCYTAHVTTRQTWANGRAACQAIGADLAVIRTTADNTMLTALIGDVEAFVGGSDRTTEGTFLWVDGSALTYTNWRVNTPPNLNEPNNGNGNYQEDCIVLQGQLGGVWDDRPCDSTEVMAPAGTHFFVCAR